MNKRKKLPKFANEDEERKFWETHDSADYMDWSIAKRALFPNLKPLTEGKDVKSQIDDLIDTRH